MRYPETRREPLVESLHGHPIADPYRWLEDADAPDVAAWVTEQRTFTEDALAALPERDWFRERMHRIVGRPRAGMPVCRGGRWFGSRNDGSSAQDVWYSASTLDELLAGGEVLLDPNTWSADGTSSLSTFSVARDGSLLCYARSDGGSDWQHMRVLDLRTGVDLDDEVTAKFTSPTWLPDHRSYLYTTFDQASDARGTATEGLGVAKLMIHRLDGEDELLLSLLDEPQAMAFGQVSHDGRWLVVSIVTGTENVNRLWVYPLSVVDGRADVGEPIKVVAEAIAEFVFVRVAESGDGHPWLYLQTDLDAPRGRVVRVDLARVAEGEVAFDAVIAETADTLVGVEAAGERLLLDYLADATSVVVAADLTGGDQQRLDLPAGALIGLDGDPDRAEALAAFSTVDTPNRSFLLDVGTDAVAVRELPLLPESDAVAPPYTVRRERARSADGTHVPYFLITPDDGASGPRPTLLYGYGGFKIPVQADYRPGWSAWLAAGGALAIANLRGGGEFGTDWYDDGRLANKQHVFDDFIGVAEHLIATGVTTAAQLAIHGRSNGGLLVGAAMTQRPELFGAALPTVGVLDVLRFHKFTIGAAWISDYGDPDTPEGFATALAYSPLHHVREGVPYPPTLVCTADHDDRVVPLHSFKFGAALQHAQSGDAPVLIRIEHAAGHGAGKSLGMVADEWADVLAFAAHHTGLVPSSDA